LLLTIKIFSIGLNSKCNSKNLTIFVLELFKISTKLFVIVEIPVLGLYLLPYYFPINCYTGISKI